MKNPSFTRKSLVLICCTGGMLVLLPSLLLAHCDTLDGPVVQDARLALQKSDIKPVLKWVKPDSEKEIKTAFGKTMKVRSLGNDAKDLADMYFFETLVRVHRAGEGAPYTGLEPAGTVVDPGIAAADRALKAKSADELMKHFSGEQAEKVREKFNAVVEKSKKKDLSVEKGREFVEAYVDYIHYVEAAMAKPGQKAEAGHSSEGHGESAVHKQHMEH